jgi:CBS domain-containing protein
MTTIGELCNRHVVIAREHETVRDAALRMREYHVGSIVIVRDGPEGRIPLGLITDRDIVTGVVATVPGRVATMTLGELGHAPLQTAREDEDFYEVLVRMRGHGLRRFPVVDAHGVLQGIIAFDDLVVFASEQLSRLAGLLQRGEARERDSLGPHAPQQNRDFEGHMRWR